MITNVLQYLEQSDKYTNQCAIADLNDSLTYSELMLYAKKVAAHIFTCSANEKEEWRNRPIAVLIDRTVWSVVCFYGIVYSGNFYVPIDPTMPEQRIQTIIDTLNPVMVIDQKNICELISEIAIDENVEMRLQKIRNEAIDTDPLYAIFTSGSTGVPKGVLISHRGVIDLVEQFADTFPFPTAPVFGNQAPLDFDVSTKDLYCALKLGGTVQMIPKKLFSTPAELVPYLMERHVNTLIWAVSAMRIVTDYKILDLYQPTEIKLVMFSGEVMPVKALNDWINHLPDTTFVNLYGPTEITCNCTYYIINRRFNNDEMLPIGIPFKNTRVILLNEKNELIGMNSKNTVGEMCVLGTGVGLGYFNNPEKTAEAYVSNPINSNYPERMYRTGDLGYYNDDNQLCFASRRDHQIKHMGHRIELGEIEVAVNALDFVDVGVCLYDEKKEKIVLCYQAKEPCNKEIVRGIAKIIPKFMWPQQFKFYQELPLNSHAKIDRVKLKSELYDEK